MIIADCNTQTSLVNTMNVAPSKLTLRELLGGGIHETRLEVDTKPRTGEQCSHGGNQIELAESF